MQKFSLTFNIRYNKPRLYRQTKKTKETKKNKKKKNYQKD